MSLQFGSLRRFDHHGDGVFLARDRAVDRSGDSDPRLSFGPRLRAGHRHFIPLSKSLYGYLLPFRGPKNHLWKVTLVLHWFGYPDVARRSGATGSAAGAP